MRIARFRLSLVSRGGITLLNEGFDRLVESEDAIARPELCGHKFARQAVLARAGFAIPPPACVPAPAFDNVVGPEVAASLAVEMPATERAAALRQRTRALGVPADLRRLLDDRFDEIAGATRWPVALTLAYIPAIYTSFLAVGALTKGALG